MMRSPPPPSSAACSSFAKLKSDVEHITERRRQGAAIRARLQLIHNHERPGRCLKGLELKHAATTTITSLRRVLDSQLITEPAAIRREVHRVLVDRFNPACGPVYPFAFQPRYTLSPPERDSFERPISDDEIVAAIRGLKRNKSPGIDGLTAEFYQRFAIVLAPLLCDLYRECFENGGLTASQRVGRIVLLPKTADTTKLQDLANWRPLTLMNVDYKILMKVLANRLRPVLSKLISPEQTYAIPGRTIHDTISSLRYIATTARRVGLPLLLTQLDLHRAFDSVRRDFLLSVLRQMNFGPQFVEWIELCYRGAASRVWVHGQWTPDIPLQNSIRQGCPLSAVLFSVCTEPLLARFQQALRIVGFHSGGYSARIFAYADDIFLVNATKDDLRNAMDLVSKYGGASGLRVNLDKSLTWCIGRCPSSWRSGMPLPTTTQGLNILGVYCGTAEYEKQNWSSLLTDLDGRLRHWKTRYLSIFGRATAWNTYLLSTLWHRSRHCSMPRLLVRRVERRGALFLWNKSWEPFRRAKLLRSPYCGGTGFVSLSLRLQVQQWVVARRHMCSASALALPPALDVFAGLHSLVFPGQCVVGHVSSSWDRDLVRTFTALTTCLDYSTLLRASPRTLYRQLLESSLGVAVPLSPPVVETTRYLHASSVNPTLKTLQWKIAHACMTTGDRLVHLGLLTERAASCDLCPEVETLQHLLWDCPAARLVWHWYQRWMRRPAPSFQYIVHPDKAASLDQACPSVILACNAFLWRQRNARRFDQAPIPRAQLWNAWVSCLPPAVVHPPSQR